MRINVCMLEFVYQAGVPDSVKGLLEVEEDGKRAMSGGRRAWSGVVGNRIGKEGEGFQYG